MKGVVGGTTTTYIGNYLECTGSTSAMKKYYYAGSQRIAMRTGSADPVWLFSDHLGSTSKAASSSGTVSYTSLYKAWGESRYTSGTAPTTYRYTGQREEVSFGLYYYNARWYDPQLGRFAQADSIVPEGVQGWDRYGYVNNNPVRYNDPSGHDVGCAGIDMGMCGIYGKSYSGWYRQAEPHLEKIIKKGNTLTYNELMETFGDIPQLTASMKAISMRYKTNNNIIQSNERDQNDAIFHFIEFVMDIHNYFEILENASNWAKPIYKQTKYVLPLGGFEYVIDAGLQFSNDYNNYPFYQAVQRSFIVAAGSWTTDVASIIGGGYGGIMGEVINPTIGGSVGYGIIAYLTSAAIDTQFQTSWYPMIFKKLGLGSYP